MNPAAPTPPPSDPAANRRRLWTVLGVTTTVLGILAAATFASRHLFEEPERARPGLAPTARAVPSGPVIAPAANPSLPFRVASLEGKVEAFRDGRWGPIKPGDALAITDVVRTGPGARAVLRRGAATELELREKVDVRLDRFSSDAASLDVLRGKVVANVAASGESLEIKARDTRSQNEGLSRFVVSVDERGLVAVASLRGSTRFAAQGKEVRLTEGTQSVALPGKAPAEPEKIPDDVLLSVVWPTGDRKDDKATIRGKVRPATQVRVNGVEAEVAPDGRFTAQIPLREGSNRVEVDAESVAGTSKRETQTVTRRTRGPGLEAEPEELWQR